MRRAYRLFCFPKYLNIAYPFEKKFFLIVSFNICLFSITTLHSQEDNKIDQLNNNSEVFGTAEKIPFSLIGDLYFLKKNTRQLPTKFDIKKSVGQLHTNSLDISPRSFRNGFPGIDDRFEWFAIDYHGFFFIREDSWYEFILESDDGSKLFIDNRFVINNDGLHATMLQHQRIFLTKGIHRMNVQYFQGPRDFIALRLWYRNDTPDFKIFSFEEFLPVEIKDETVENKDETEIVSVEINSSVLFDLDEYLLKEEAKIILDEIYVSYIKNNINVGMIVKGYTDNTGSEEHNLNLSKNRALSVCDYYMDMYGLKERIWPLSFGEAKPKYNNDTEENRAKNRRVEILIMDAEKAKEHINTMNK